MANTTQESKIPTVYLPDDWKAQGAEAFNCSKNKIERIVYGLVPITPKNQVIFDFMLKLAEDGKAKAETVKKQFNDRLKALSE